MNEAQSYAEAIRLIRYDFRNWFPRGEQSMHYTVLTIAAIGGFVFALGFSGYHYFQGNIGFADAFKSLLHLTFYVPLGMISLVLFFVAGAIAFTKDLGKWRWLSCAPLSVIAFIQGSLYLVAPDIYRHLL